MELKFTDFVNKVVNSMSGDIQDANCVNMPKPADNQQVTEINIPKIVIQLTQEGLTISNNGYLITLPPPVSKAIQIFFESFNKEKDNV